ncbi:MAG: hypothetical protein MJ106_02220, partial [Lentisphaeria bacterium]|nr:hypothetical protein [Lentisphaeria bacterium]
MKRFSLLSFVVCAVLFAGEWTFSPQIPAQQSRLVRMRLKADEIAWLGERTDWLRLRDKFGMEVPYAISMEMETTSVATERAFPCDVTQIRTLDDGSVEILCELKDAKAPEKLTMRFSTKMHDFEEQVQIFGETTNGWKTLCDDGFIFDSSRLPNLRNLDVAFQRAECLRFRILLSQGSFEYKNALRHIVASESSTAGTERSEATDMEVRDFKMDGFEVRGVVETQRSGAPCLVPIPARSLVHGSSRYEYIVTPSFYPVYGLKLDSDSDYFSRKLRIFREDSNGGGASFVQDAVINRLRLSGFSQEETSVRFSPVNNGNLRLEFDSDVAIPLELSS